jgi:predicted DNA-binding transcriptional regulator AlpA
MQMNAPDSTQSVAVPDPIDSPRTVDRRLGWCSTTRWRLAKAGQFPAAIRLSPGRIGYRRSDIDAWLAAREAK